jgi:hypothetical protein
MTVGTSLLNEPPNVPRMPNDLKWEKYWRESENWLIRATKMQNNFNVVNAGRKYEKSADINSIEIYILISAFGEPQTKKFKKI